MVEFRDEWANRLSMPRAIPASVKDAKEVIRMGYISNDDAVDIALAIVCSNAETDEEVVIGLRYVIWQLELARDNVVASLRPKRKKALTPGPETA